MVLKPELNAGFEAGFGDIYLYISAWPRHLSAAPIEGVSRGCLFAVQYVKGSITPKLIQISSQVDAASSRMHVPTWPSCNIVYCTR